MKKLLISIFSFLFIGFLVFFMLNQHSNPSEEIERENHEPSQQSLYAAHEVDYAFQNAELLVTFDQGENWTHVPIEKELLFQGEYNGNEQELIEGSYILTKDRVAFIYSEYVNKHDHSYVNVRLLYSLDRGKTWENVVVKPNSLPIRFRKVDFLNDDFGYIVLSSERVTSQELANMYVTYNGGESWQEVYSEVTRLIYAGGFTDEQTGFLSFGFINPDKPQLYVTQDSGTTWYEANVQVPEKYNEIFLIAETPFNEEDYLAVLINQGPSGDYLGGKVKGKFISKDSGKTWEFSTEVSPEQDDSTYE